MKGKLETYVKTYEEPELDENGKLLVKMNSGKVVKKDQSNDDNMGSGEGGNIDGDLNNGDDEDANNLADLKAQMPLGQGVLQVNLGIPIIVVCSKIDLMARGDKA
jgi:hypothetical protein